MVELPGLERANEDRDDLAQLGHLSPGSATAATRRVKRTIDIFGAALLLLLALPAIALGAIAVRLSSRGPILFTQQRVGRGGRHFRVFKLRTMVVDAEDLLEGLRSLSRDPHWLALDHDPRVTRTGRFLRRLSVDELPQLWNVLRGEMSLVGPRPLPAAEDRNVPGWAGSRRDVAPGITGLWQVRGRNNLSFSEMVELDHHYVANWSLWLDLKILLTTLPAVVSRRGAF